MVDGKGHRTKRRSYTVDDDLYTALNSMSAVSGINPSDIVGASLAWFLSIVNATHKTSGLTVGEAVQQLTSVAPQAAIIPQIVDDPMASEFIKQIVEVIQMKNEIEKKKGKKRRSG